MRSRTGHGSWGLKTSFPSTYGTKCFGIFWLIAVFKIWNNQPDLATKKCPHLALRCSHRRFHRQTATVSTANNEVTWLVPKWLCHETYTSSRSVSVFFWRKCSGSSFQSQRSVGPKPLPFQHIEICLIPDGTAKRELSGGLQGSASRERLGSSLGHHADHWMCLITNR